ncbi:hypothetical protein Pmar_PMAR014626, partial [Perkinsus marinus ATCC 50983]
MMRILYRVRRKRSHFDRPRKIVCPPSSPKTLLYSTLVKGPGVGFHYQSARGSRLSRHRPRLVRSPPMRASWSLRG